DTLKYKNKTIADRAKTIGKKIGKNESKITSTNGITANTANRNIKNLNNELDGLFAYQEDLKIANQIPTKKVMALGGEITGLGSSSLVVNPFGPTQTEENPFAGLIAQVEADAKK